MERRLDSDVDWRPIPGIAYEASSCGQIRESESHALLKQTLHNHGYLHVRVWDGCDVKQKRYVHRLVCAAFHGAAPYGDYHADHIDNVRGNNRASNLRWLDAKENRDRRVFARGAVHGRANLDDDKVAKIRSMANDNLTHEAIAGIMGVSRRTVGDVINRVTWSHVA